MTATSPETTLSRSALADREIPGSAPVSPSPRGFFQDLVARAVDATDAVAGAAWSLTPQGILAQIAAIQFAETRPASDQAAARQHVQLLLEVLHHGRPRIHRDASPASAAHPAGGEHVLLLAPVSHRGNCLGVVELFLRRDTTDEEATPRLAMLEGAARDAARYLESRSTSNSASLQDDFAWRLLSFVQELHGHLSVKGVAAAAVNEGRVLLGCDRATLVAVRRKGTEVIATSGVERVRERSNLVRAMKDVAEIVLATGQLLNYSGAAQSLPPHVKEPLVSYLADSGGCRLSAVPLFESCAAERDPSTAPAPCGVLLLEWFSEDGREASLQRAQLVARHVSKALNNALLHEDVLPAPVWKLLQRPRGRTERAARRRPALCAAAACAGLALVLALPVPYYVQADGELAPVVHLGVFAPEDGEVVDVAVRGGEQIAEGQVLLRLRNERLAAEHLQARNLLVEKEQQLAALAAERGSAVERGAGEAAIRLEGRIAQTQIELDGLREQVDALAAELAQLEVRARVSGTVATFQPAQVLLNRPVQRGELLLEVIDESGPWQLDLQIPANRLGAVLEACQSEEAPRLPVRFALATAPEQTFEGLVHRLGTRVDAAADGTPILEARAAVDAEQIPVRTSGTEVSARIYCGRRCLAYWLFGDALNFLKRRVW